jgi:hypothetical protein
LIYSLLAALVAVNIAYLVFLDRKDARERAERQTLLQRIQAPEAAVVEHQVRHAEPDEPYPLTDEEAAEEMRQTVERLEKIEAEAAPWLR